jgi:hypothetical protein
MTRRRRLGRLVAATLAAGFLVAMALSGRVRDSGQFVRFSPAGVLTSAPTEIDRVEVNGTGRRWVFTRAAAGWRMEPDTRPVPPAVASHLDDALKFLHASGPIRVLEQREWSEHGLREFGLDPPLYSAALFRDRRQVLAVAFGSENPQKVLQYMRVDGRDQILVMSRSMGREWEQVLSEAGR